MTASESLFIRAGKLKVPVKSKFDEVSGMMIKLLLVQKEKVPRKMITTFCADN